jgi:hypothetical protein
LEYVSSVEFSIVVLWFPRKSASSQWFYVYTWRHYLILAYFQSKIDILYVVTGDYKYEIGAIDVWIL